MGKNNNYDEEMNVDLYLNYKQKFLKKIGSFPYQQLIVSTLDSNNNLTIIKSFFGNEAAGLYAHLATRGTECCGNDPDSVGVIDDHNVQFGENEEFDDISHAEHYNSGYRFEPRKVISDWDLNFNLGNTVKYISRAGRKGDKLTDLKKAAQYLQWEIERLEND